MALGELLTLFNSSFNTDILDLNISYSITMLWILNREWHFYIHKNGTFSMNNLIFDVKYPTFIHQVNKFVTVLFLMKLYHLKKQRCTKASCLLTSISEDFPFSGSYFQICRLNIILSRGHILFLIVEISNFWRDWLWNLLLHEMGVIFWWLP